MKLVFILKTVNNCRFQLVIRNNDFMKLLRIRFTSIQSTPVRPVLILSVPFNVVCRPQGSTFLSVHANSVPYHARVYNVLNSVNLKQTRCSTTTSLTTTNCLLLRLLTSRLTQPHSLMVDKASQRLLHQDATSSNAGSNSDVKIQSSDEQGFYSTSTAPPSLLREVNDNTAVNVDNGESQESDEVPSYNLSFAGCGFLGIYHLGVVACLLKHGRSFMETHVHQYGGASAGGLVAAILATRGLDDEVVTASTKFVYDLALKVKDQKLGLLTPRFNALEFVKEFLQEALPENAHKIAENRLHISMTRVKNSKNIIVNSYESRDELISCLLASSYVPFLTGNNPIIYKGKKYMDGGLTENIPFIPGGRTIQISPFSGSQDICPTDKQGAGSYARINGQDFQINFQNIIRGYHAFFPPKVESLDSYYQRGFKDAARFLQRENMFEENGGNDSVDDGSLKNSEKNYETSSKVHCDDLSAKHKTRSRHFCEGFSMENGENKSKLLNAESKPSNNDGSFIQYETCI